MGNHTLESVTVVQITRYVRTIRAEEEGGVITRRTAHGILRVLKQFWNWASAKYDVPNVAAHVKLPRLTRLPPRALDLATVKALLEATPDTPIGLRDRAIVVFILDTGCRNGGVCGLRIEDLNLTGRYAEVMEKGGHKRVVPLTMENIEYLSAWAKVRPASSEYVFCSMRKANEGQALTTNGLQQILRRLARRANVTERVFAHALRHTMATQYARNGGNLATLQAILGHADIRSTQMYVSVDRQTLIEQHERYSPAKALRDSNKRA